MKFNPIISIGEVALLENYDNDRLIGNEFVKLIHWSNVTGSYKFQIENMNSDKHIYIKWNEYPEHSWRILPLVIRKRIIKPLKQ